jgi:hypothetical protein
MLSIFCARTRTVVPQTITHAVLSKGVAKVSVALVDFYIGTTLRCYIVLVGLVQI